MVKKTKKNANFKNTDLFIRRLGPLQFFLRGNIDGTPYERVGDNGSINVSPPQMYIDGNLEYIGEGGNAEYWSGQNSNGEFSNYNAPYTERVVGAPYFLSFNIFFSKSFVSFSILVISFFSTK